MNTVSYNNKTKKVYIYGNFSSKTEKTFISCGFKRKQSIFYGNYLNWLKYASIEPDHNIFINEDMKNHLLTIKDTYVDNKDLVSKYIEEECPIKLYEFQKEFVNWFHDPLRTINCSFNASEMGLGKSFMALAASFSLNKDQQIVIFSPKNGIGNWIEHLHLFGYDKKIDKKFNVNPEMGINILTYDSLPPLIEEANKKKRSLEDYKKDIPKNLIIIADEIHLIRNTKAKRSKKFIKFINMVKAKGGKIIALTGTPILNRPEEFKNILNTLDLLKISFGNISNFNKHFGIEYNHYLGRNEYDPNKRNPMAIKEAVKFILFRKTREEVLDQLPDINNKNIIVELNNDKIKKELDKYLFSKWDIDKLTNTQLAEYTKTKSMLAEYKLPYLEELVESYEDADKPVIVFSCNKQCVETIGNRIGWKYIHGDISPNKRQEYVNMFNRGELKGLSISIRTGNAALNIHGTDTAIFLDLDVVAGYNAQAKARINRISSQKSSLNYVHIISTHPFERDMHNLLLSKESLTQDVVD